MRFPSVLGSVGLAIPSLPTPGKKNTSKCPGSLKKVGGQLRGSWRHSGTFQLLKHYSVTKSRASVALAPCAHVAVVTVARVPQFLRTASLGSSRP